MINKIKSILNNQYFILFTLTILALFIRILNIDKPYGLWYDEMLTYVFSSKSFPFGILRTLLRYDFHMPLYYLYVHFWMKFFGSSDVVLRFSSVLWGVLSVPASYYLGKIYRTKSLGWFMAIVVCLNPAMIYFSQEFRLYSMLIFFVFISLIFFLKLIDKPNKNALFFFGLSNLIILYIYTSGIIFVFFETLILLINLYLYKKDFLVNFLRYIGIFFIFSMPYLVLLFSYLEASSQSLIPTLSVTYRQNIYLPLCLINDLFSPILTCLLGMVDFKEVISVLGFNRLTVIFMLIPSFCFITGFILSLKNLNKPLLYLLIILLSIILTDGYLYLKGDMSLCLKYIIVVFPIALLICADGLLAIKNIFIKKICILLILMAYIFNLVNYKVMTPFESRAMGYKFPAEALRQLNFKTGDYILHPLGAVLFKKYINIENVIPISFHEIVNLDKTKKEALKVFSEDFVLNTNAKNSASNFIPYFTSSKPTIGLETFINSYIDKIPKGKKLIFITDILNEYNPNDIRNYIKNQQKLPKRELYGIFYIRFIEDIRNILQNNLLLEKVETVETMDPGKATKKWYFIIYKKL